MKLLYAARMARLDLLRAINHLACFITKWDTECDKRLHRLMCYVHSSLDLKQLGWMGDTLDDISIHLYADADFAGDIKTSKSTSGVFLCIRGTHTMFPISGTSKRQQCVSHSTPEAELVAADLALRSYGIPALPLWELILGRALTIVFHEDNQAMIQIMKSGKSDKLRHVGRTHRVSIHWLHERFQEPHYKLEYCESADQAADVFTKAFQDRLRWARACELINHVVPSQVVRYAGVPKCTTRGGTPAAPISTEIVDHDTVVHLDNDHDSDSVVNDDTFTHDTPVVPVHKQRGMTGRCSVDAKIPFYFVPCPAPPAPGGPNVCGSESTHTTPSHTVLTRGLLLRSRHAAPVCHA